MKSKTNKKRHRSKCSFAGNHKDESDKKRQSKFCKGPVSYRIVVSVLVPARVFEVLGTRVGGVRIIEGRRVWFSCSASGVAKHLGG